MNRKQRIEKILLKSFNFASIEVLDNSFEHSGHNNFDGTQETHFKIYFSNQKVNSLSRLELHRKINILLKDEFKKGLHALEIKIVN